MSKKRLPLFVLAGLAAPAMAQPGVTIPGEVFFTDHTQFQQFNQQDGKILKGIETFEEAVIPPGGKTAFPNPLTHGVPRTPFPNGIDEDNLLIQSNVTAGPYPPAPNPGASPNSLYVIDAGFLGANSKKVGEDEFLNNIWASVDLMFLAPDLHTGVGFWLSRFQGYPTGGWQMGVYDTANVLIGTYTMGPPLGPEPNKTFFGVWAPVPIGRINIFDMAGPVPDAIDDVEMWRVPSPGALGLLACGGLAAMRRRRRA